MNQTRNRAKFRMPGISFEQAVVAFLTKYPDSTAEQIHRFVQHPDFKNFSTILSAMKANKHLTRNEDRPAKWRVAPTSEISVPDIEINLEGFAPTPTPVEAISPTPTPEPSNVLEAAVKRLAEAQQVIAQATSNFNSLLPNLDDASRQRIFQMMCRGTVPSSTTHLSAKVAMTEKSGTGVKRIRRSSETIQEVTESITKLLRKHPEGLRAGQLCEELGLEAKELPKPIAEGLANKAFKRRGERRLTTYYIPGPKKPVTKEAEVTIAVAS